MDSDSSQSSCSLCIHKGRMCHENCEYRQIFPGNRHEEFENANKLFGVNNMLTIIQSVEANQRQVAADSMFVEANAWRNHPVHGVLGFASDLIFQIQSHSNQLQAARNQLEIFKHRHSISSSPFATSSSSSSRISVQSSHLHDSAEMPSIMGGIVPCEEVKPLDVQQITRLLEYHRRGRGRPTSNEIKEQDKDQRNVVGKDGEIASAEVSEDEN